MRPNNRRTAGKENGEIIWPDPTFSPFTYLAFDYINQRESFAPVAASDVLPFVIKSLEYT